MKTKKKAGRPKGSQNVSSQSQSVPSRCVKCDSTARTHYRNRIVEKHGGTYQGKPFTHIVRQQTRCSDCGHPRIDRTYHYWPNGEPGDAE